MNQYPLWKYLLIGAVIFICALFALPNLFGEDPAVQISPSYARDIKIDETVQNTVETTLREANIPFISCISSSVPLYSKSSRPLKAVLNLLLEIQLPGVN